MAIKPSKTMLCTVVTENGTFTAVRSAVVLSVGWAYWIPLLISISSYNKKDRLSLSEELKAGQFYNCRLDLFIVKQKGRTTAQRVIPT